MVFTAGLLGLVGPQPAAAATISSTPSSTEPYLACPAPTPGYYECPQIVEPAAYDQTRSALGEISPAEERTGELGGWSPENLKHAYKLPATGGKGETVAIVDAYNYPDAEADLKVYREHYKLYYKGTETCTRANECFQKINQEGKSSAEETSTIYPKAEFHWAKEMSLDMDMVSAVCPECKILLVEATSNSYANFDTAEDEAATFKEGAKFPGTTVISNSWYGLEETSETEKDVYFDHPGIPVVFAAGDEGYGARYPASSPYVISAGGTELTKETEPYKTERKWSEQVWPGTDSGCSAYEEKPPWQTGPPWEAGKSCTHRTDNDVAAVAKNLSAYDSYELSESERWDTRTGTSAATPITAAVEALSSSATRTLAADAFYQKPSMLFHISEGSNGECGSESSVTYFLCHATKEGYNGPTGEGTPDNVFTSIVPAGATGFATKVEAKGATLNGIVNPNGATTKYYFEYGTTESYGTKTTEVSVGSGSSNLEESKAITGLTGGTKYDFRVVTTNANGTTDGLNQVFTTPSKPFVETRAATGVGETEATLHGIVNPEGEETKYKFEYGPSEAYGKTTPEASAGSGTSNVEVSATITGLEPGKPYDFRIIATNGVGTSEGGNKAFATYLWTDEFPVNPGSWDYLSGVSCTSASSCEGVGVQLPSEKYETLAEVWNGTEWKAQTTPNRAEYENHLEAVSCTSATACIAVGNTGGYETLAEVWNGTEWKIQSSQNVVGAEWTVFYGVSCTSATACTAVGAYRNSAGKDVTLAERWNGTEWMIQTTPNQTEFAENYLESVSCTSASECEAVGFSAKVGTTDTLAEHWNGTEWKIQASPSPEGKSTLHSVSCSSATACTAIGVAGSATLAERWNGSEWATQTIPNPAEALESELWGVSCATSTSCVAVGQSSSTKSGRVGLAEQWSGNEWTLESTPNPEKATETLLWGVSCTSAMSCTAAGRYDLGKFKTLAEKLS